MKLLDFFRNRFRRRQIFWQEVGALGQQYSGGVSQNADVSELLEAYRGWVYACTSLIARNVAKVPLRLFEKQMEDWVEIEDHVLVDLLESPNPVHTQFELWEITVSWLELTGNAYWYLARNRLGVPAEIWPIPPDRMTVVPDQQELIAGYLYRYQGREVAFDREEIIHLRYPNPHSIYYGIGPLQAAAYSYDLDMYMKKYSVNLFKSDGRPTGVLMTDQVLDQGTIERIREAWKRIYGGVDNAGKIAVLQAGTKYERLQISPAELDYLASRRATRDDILGIFGVPASKLGLVEDVNRANAEANDYTFQSEVIKPRLKMIEAKLNKHLVPMFDDALWLEFDDPVPENEELKLKQMESRLKNYVTAINEERADLGLEPAAWGDEPLVPFNLVPVGEIVSSQDSFSQVPQPRQTPKPKAKTVRVDREKEWRAFLQVHLPVSEAFRRIFPRFFNEQEKVVLKNLEKAFKSFPRSQKADPALVDFILFNLNEWIDKLRGITTPQLRNMFEKGVEKALSDLAVGDFEFNFNHPKVAAFIRQRANQLSFEVNETTFNQLKEELIAGLDAGEGLAQLAERVKKVFDFAATWRSLRIARTETTVAVNSGIHQAFEQTGIVKGKMWLSSRDDNVRATHLGLDGKIVPLDGKFQLQTGEVLAYPGDPNAPAAEVVNCRCTILPALSEDEF